MAGCFQIKALSRIEALSLLANMGAAKEFEHAFQELDDIAYASVGKGLEGVSSADRTKLLVCVASILVVARPDLSQMLEDIERNAHVRTTEPSPSDAMASLASYLFQQPWLRRYVAAAIRFASESQMRLDGFDLQAISGFTELAKRS